MGSIFLRGKTYYLKYKDAANVWRMLSSGKTDRQQALDVLTKIEHKELLVREQNEEDPRERVADPTVSELIQWWLVRRTPVNESVMATCALTIINDPFGNLIARTLKPRDVRTWLDRLHETRAASTCNWIRGLVSAAYAAARRESWPADNWFKTNPIYQTKTVHDHYDPNVDAEDYPVLKAEQIAPVLLSIDPKHRALFAAAIHLGLRRGELCALRKTDVNFALSKVLVRRTYDKNTTKTLTTRAVPINSDLAPWLANAIAEAEDRWGGVCELVFPDAYGRMRSPTQNLSNVLRHAMLDSGVAQPGDRLLNMTFHDLRHTTASLLIEAGAELSEVQTYLGHSNPAVTAKIYVHLSKDHLARVGRLMEGRFGIGASAATPETQQPPRQS